MSPRSFGSTKGDSWPRSDIILVGGTGSGKTHLAIAIAIARQAIRNGKRGRYFNLLDLVNLSKRGTKAEESKPETEDKN